MVNSTASGTEEYPLKTPVLVVARSDRRREGLVAVLNTIPSIEVMGQAAEVPTVFNLIFQYHPALILLDTDLPEERTWSLLKAIKWNYPQISCLVTVDRAVLYAKAKAFGADAILMQGFRTAELFAALEKLLPSTD